MSKSERACIVILLMLTMTAPLAFKQAWTTLGHVVFFALTSVLFVTLNDDGE